MYTHFIHLNVHEYIYLNVHAFHISECTRISQQASTSSTKTFNDVVGVDEAKAEVQEIVEFLKNPQKFTRLGGKMTKGALNRMRNTRSRRACRDT